MSGVVMVGVTTNVEESDVAGPLLPGIVSLQGFFLQYGGLSLRG